MPHFPQFPQFHFPGTGSSSWTRTLNLEMTRRLFYHIAAATGQCAKLLDLTFLGKFFNKFTKVNYDRSKTTQRILGEKLLWNDR
jgi:hypothetical protein